MYKQIFFLQGYKISLSLSLKPQRDSGALRNCNHFVSDYFSSMSYDIVKELPFICFMLLNSGNLLNSSLASFYFICFKIVVGHFLGIAAEIHHCLIYNNRIPLGMACASSTEKIMQKIM
ncbi:hypothetical protein ACJX0J_036539, partial [Zea mays]